MTQVKICGLNDTAGFDAATGADWVGFVFYPPSPRYVTPAQAAALSSRHAGGPRRVGLFVNPTPADIAATLAELDLDILQIYAPDAGDLERAFKRPVWRAVGVAGLADLPHHSDTAGLVIEARPPKGANRPGGNATRFDWSILANWQPPCPWVLAGGLTPGNVREAIGITGAPAVDTSSGVESRPGAKDPALIAAFLAAARSQ